MYLFYFVFEVQNTPQQITAPCWIRAVRLIRDIRDSQYQITLTKMTSVSYTIMVEMTGCHMLIVAGHTMTIISPPIRGVIHSRSGRGGLLTRIHISVQVPASDECRLYSKSTTFFSNQVRHCVLYLHHETLSQCFSAGTVYRRQNLTSVDVIFCRLKSFSPLQKSDSDD